jgi:hypothetical protein
VQSIGDEKLVIDMLVGELQRVIEYPKLGFAIEQAVPVDVVAAYERLLAAGFDSRLPRSCRQPGTSRDGWHRLCERPLRTFE